MAPMNEKKYLIINPEGKNDLSKPYACFYYGIKWIPNEIAGYKNANGYIVQRIKIDAPEYLKGFTYKEYYEAWSVQDGKVQYKNVNNEVWGHMAEDDVFKYYSEAMEESLFKKGVIYYYAIVYWIDKKSKYYEIVDKWEEGAIAQAGILKASETFDVSKIIPVFERDVFEFSFDFRDESVIKEEMLKRGRNMFSSQKKYERDNYVCTYRDIFINNDKKALFEDIIVQLQEEFQNEIVCK